MDSYSNNNIIIIFVNDVIINLEMENTPSTGGITHEFIPSGDITYIGNTIATFGRDEWITTTKTTTWW
jgi:hypothetical protein